MTVRIDEGYGFILVSDRGFGLGLCSADDEALVLVGDEEKELVLDDGAADAPAVVDIAGLGLLGRGCEGTVVGEELVAVVVVGVAVEDVGTGLDGEVDGAARVTAGFGHAAGDERELVDGVERNDDAGDTGDAALVDGGDVPPEIVVVGTVDLPVDLVGANAVDLRRRRHPQSSRRSLG